MSLINHLLAQVGVDSDGLAAKIFRNEPTTVTLTNVAGSTVKMGNQTLERKEDGSLKIVTQLPNNTVSFVVLNVDGGVQLHGPGYLG